MQKMNKKTLRKTNKLGTMGTMIGRGLKWRNN